MKRSFVLILIAVCSLMVAGRAFAQADPYNTQPQPAAAPSSTTSTSADTSGQNDVPAGATQPSGSTSSTGAATGTGVTDQQAGQGGTGQPTNEMPRTASPLPLVALVGLLSIGAALTLRAASRSRSRSRI